MSTIFTNFTPMKYRILTNEELIPLEEDLKAFLIVNGVDGSEWGKINAQNPDKAIELVELFSDVVLQKVYEKIKFLEFRSATSCMVFKCGKEVIELISIQTTDASEDLSTIESLHEALKKEDSKLTFFKSTKNYSGSREREVHEMIESGCLLSSEEFWLLLVKSL